MTPDDYKRALEDLDWEWPNGESDNLSNYEAVMDHLPVIRHALTLLASDDYVVVPRVPTKSMLSALYKARNKHAMMNKAEELPDSDAYQAIIAAAPNQPGER